jgi:lipoprotein-anchoring transpeptidase ErfK/SrfK
MQSIYNKNLEYLKYPAVILLVILSTTILNFSQTGKTTSIKKLSPSQLIYQAEKSLSEKGYWITKVDNKKDSSTYHALVAFQKVEGRKKTGILNKQELQAIQRSNRPHPVYIGIKHIEIDLIKQVLFLVNDDNLVTHILPVSTGNGKIYYENGKKQIATTPLGIFRITRQIKGIRRAPLGTLYHPNYFYNGVAIHGSNSIPFYPASHGCVRIPRFAAKDFSNLVKVGLLVIVHKISGKEKQLIPRRISQGTINKNESQNIPCETQVMK